MSLDLTDVEVFVSNNTVWKEEAIIEYSGLEPELKLELMGHLSQIIRWPHFGVDLGNRNGMDLTGYKKILFDNARKRLIYKVYDNDGKIFVLGIGPRATIYQNVYERIRLFPNTV